MKIPAKFLSITYNPKQIPGSELSIFEHGANCQLFAYHLLAHFGKVIPPLRSSDLWEDTQSTIVITEQDGFKPLDVMLYHSTDQAWGAHVGLFIGDGKVIHLSQELGHPEVRDHYSFSDVERYRYFIGAKRVL